MAAGTIKHFASIEGQAEIAASDTKNSKFSCSLFHLHNFASTRNSVCKSCFRVGYLFRTAPELTRRC